MNTYDQLRKDLKDSMMEGDSERTSVIRMLISAIRNKEIEKEGELSEEEVLSIIRTESKKVKDSIEQFESAGREDLSEKEECDLKIISSYLPTLLDESDTRKLVKETMESVRASGMKDMGRVMGKLMAEHKMQLDGSLASRLVKEELSKL